MAPFPHRRAVFAPSVLVAAALVAGTALTACGSSRGATPTTTAATTSPPTTSRPTTSPATTSPATTSPGTTRPGTTSPAPSRPSTSGATAGTTATTGPDGTSGGPWHPLAPAPSDYQAAQELLNAWYENDRVQALSVATAGSVRALFARAYPAAGVQQRGCSAPLPGLPATCVYRYGTADGILSLTVAPFSNGWGVTAVQVES